MNRRHLLALPALLATPAAAQGRPVRLIVPFIAGSAPDVVARQLADRLGGALSAPVVVENRPGAGGNIGFEYVARTQQDGPLLMLGTNSLVINPALHSSPLRFDPLRDFVPVNLAVAMPHILIVPPNGPADVAALIASLRAQPEQNYASGGNGSGAHLAAEMFRARAEVRVTHVPFRGAPDIVNAVMAGTVSFGFPTLATATELVRAGRLRALAVTSPQRNQALPAVPALAETLAGFDLVSWFALLAPANAAPDFVRRVDEAVRAAFADAAFRDRVQADGSVAVAMPSAAFGEFLRAEQAKWSEAVRLSGARVD